MQNGLFKLFTESLTTEDTESFADTEFSFGRILHKGLRLAGSLLGGVSESGFSRLGGSQADTEVDVNSPESSAYTYNAMTQRAISGEAALEALLQTPVETLQQEGVFNAMKGPVNKWVPKFLKLLKGLGSGAAAVKYLLVSGKEGEMQGGAGVDQEMRPIQLKTRILR